MLPSNSGGVGLLLIGPFCRQVWKVTAEVMLRARGAVGFCPGCGGAGSHGPELSDGAAAALGDGVCGGCSGTEVPINLLFLKAAVKLEVHFLLQVTGPGSGHTAFQCVCH